LRKIIIPFVFLIIAGIFVSATVKIMPVGDSLTSMNSPGYRGYLFQMLKDSGFVVDFVGGHQSLPTDPLNTDADNSGFGGFVIGPKGADIIILMIGVNDFWNNKNTAYSPSRDGAIRLDTLVEKIYRLSLNVKLVLSNLTPRKVDLTGNDYAKFNAGVPLIVEKQKAKGRACYFVDNNKGDFVTADYLDGVHFVATGFQKLANNFYKALAPVLKSMTANAGINSYGNSKIGLYPNPATNHLFIKNLTGSIRIVNVLGQSIISIENYQGEEINIKTIPSGTYIVKAGNAAKQFIKR